jgi:glycosyltransferase involved in cell wall biosynthesis
MNPLVSICIPTYNRASLLEKAVASALAQTIDNYEILIVDNNSEDDTEEKIRRFLSTQLRYVRNPQNVGMIPNWNKCIDLAHGKYICILHSDDYIEPQLLEMESSLLEGDPRIGMVYSAHYLAHELTGRRKTVVPHRYSRILDGKAQFESLISRGNYIAFSGVLVRKSCYQDVGLFNTGLPYSSDLEMWLRICLKYSIGYLNIPLVTYRFHGEMDSFSFFASSDAVDQEWEAIQTALSQTHRPENECQQLIKRARRQLAGRSMRRAFFHADKGMSIVRKHLAKVVRFNPQMRLHPLYWLILLFTSMGDRVFSLLNRVRVGVLKSVSR